MRRETNLLPQGRETMARQIRFGCTWSVLVLFLFAILSPEEACAFDTDTLKTAGIITGITVGVALVIVLVVGTVRDMKRDRDEEDEQEKDVWSGNPVLRALGYRPLKGPLPDSLGGPQPEWPPGTFSRRTRSPLPTAYRAAKPPLTSSTYLAGNWGETLGQGSIGQGGSPSKRSSTIPSEERKRISRER